MLAELTQTQAFATAAAAALEPVRQQMQAVAEQIARDLAPVQRQFRSLVEAHLSAACLSRAAADRDAAADSVTVRVLTARTTSRVGPVAVEVEDAATPAEDMYRLLGYISLQLDDIAAGKSASPVELYNAITQTLALLVALIALLAPDAL